MTSTQVESGPMGIEFRCTRCDRLLRTPDGTSGRQAKCPQCGGLSTIPETSAPLADEVAERSDPRSPPQPATERFNPLDSPGASEVRAPAAEPPRELHPTRIDLNEVLSRTWRIYRDHFWECVGTYFVALILGNAFFWGATLLTWDSPTVVQTIGAIAANIANFGLSLGVLIYLARLARGEPATLADLLSAAPFLGRALGVVVLWTIAMIVGVMLLVFPFFIVLVMFAPAVMIVLDQNVGVLEAFDRARDATQGNRLTIFVLGVVALLGGALMMALTCGLGAFVVLPFWWLLYVVSYLEMTGQRIAAPTAAPTMTP